VSGEIKAPGGALGDALGGTWHPEGWEIYEVELVGVTDESRHVFEHLKAGCKPCEEKRESARRLLLSREGNAELEAVFADFPPSDAPGLEKEAYYSPFKTTRKPQDKNGALAYDGIFIGRKILQVSKEGPEKLTGYLLELRGNPSRGYAMLYAAQYAQQRATEDPKQALLLARVLLAFSRSLPYKEGLGSEQPVFREQVLAEASITESFALNWIGNHEEARQAAVRAREFFTAGREDDFALALSDYFEGSALSFANRFEDAVRLLKKASYEFRSYGQTDWVGRAEGMLGVMAVNRGRYNLGLYHLDLALKSLHPEAEDVAYAGILVNRGFTLVRLNQLNEAKRTYARALVMVRRSGLKAMLYPIRHGLATIELAKGALSRALELFMNLSKDATLDGMGEHVVTAELHIAECLGRLGRLDDMRKRIEVLRKTSFDASGIGPALLELFSSLDEGAISTELLSHVADYAEQLSRGNVVPYRSFRVRASG
jgi:tetratricopeptide (TPR) repeat protein